MTPPPKAPNADRRSREHRTKSEVERLIAAARQLGRHGQRDAAMILLADRHGLRVCELVSLRWEQVDLRQGLLHVRRRKNGLPRTHPLRGLEIRALRQVLRDDPDSADVFVSERKAPMTAANDGQDTRAIQHDLGHRNIQHTTLYTQLAAGRFNDFWTD
jgi:type 1 fimbriae regulatory protein FimB/type 1 fimbriae regulatory protein FimE